ncbi:MAG: ADP-ribosylglycohydrolase family protein [bacterium]|nr:ADP-ribosylglycohydrolase family protein [bacterium]
MAKKHLGLLFKGLAVGDSLGTTSKFTSREEVLTLYEQYKEKGWPFRHVGNGYFKVRPGQLSDDAVSAVCMVRSYLQHGKFDPEDIAVRLVEWAATDPHDVGVTTQQGLKNIADGTPWYEGGLKDFRRRPLNASNGSLLRNGIIPGMADTLDDAFRLSLYQSIMTHYAPRPVIACGFHTWVIWENLEGRKPLKIAPVKNFERIWTEWLENSDDEYVRGWRENVGAELPKAWKALRETDFDPMSFSPFVYSPRGGAGFVLTTLQIAVWAMHWSVKKSGFRVPEGYPPEVFAKRGPWVLGWVAMTGGDTDSYGATAGPMIAAALKELPDEMLDGLEVTGEFMVNQS